MTIACCTRPGQNTAAYFESGTATILPEADDIPQRYDDLLEWYEEWSRSQVERAIQSDQLLALYGSGKHLWADEHADEYVARLRAGWK
jgi:hypothetical protein